MHLWSQRLTSFFFSRQITSWHFIQFKMCYLHVISISHHCLWYFFSNSLFKRLAAIIWSVVFQVFKFSLLEWFDSWESHYPYLEAYHFLTALKLAKGCFNLCRAGLSESKYWCGHPTAPYGKKPWVAICGLYHGYWYWFVYSSSVTSMSDHLLVPQPT